MKERIIVTSDINGTELLRSLAANGRDSFGVRIITPVELARLALARSGSGIPGELVTADAETALIISALSNNGYFQNGSFADAEAIAASLKTLRLFIAQNEAEAVRALLKAGPFPKKNDAILGIFERYMKLCAEKNIVDGVALVRHALENALPMDSEFITLTESTLTPLEERLVAHLSCGSWQEYSLPELFRKRRVAPMLADITNAYGASNETEHILNDILDSGTPLDACVVATASTVHYSQLFLDMAQRFDLPVTFGCGVPIMNANPAKLLNLLNTWNGPGHHGRDALFALINSDAFHRAELKTIVGESVSLVDVINTAGNLRLSMDKAENEKKLARFCYYNGTDLAEAAKSLAHELEKGFAYIIEKYSLVRRGNTLQGKIDRSAVKVLGEALSSFARFGLEEDIPKLVPLLLKKTVSSENSREGFLHVTSIAGARAVLRKKLYIAGLSAENFPGTPCENPILLDEDYAPLKNAVGVDALPISDNLVDQTKRSLFELTGLFSAMGVAAHLSFSGYDVCELKEENPSAALFELYEKSGADASFESYQSSMKPVGYFEKTLSLEHGIGKAYMDKKRFDKPPEKKAEIPRGCSLERAFSPSAIDTFFDCPRRFFLQYALGIKPKEPDDPLIWMDALSRGTLAHSIMEYCANKQLSSEAFTAYVADRLDEYEAARPCISDHTRDKTEFFSMMERAYLSDPGNEVISSEVTLLAKHPSGILLTGKPDRLEKTPLGEYIVVDYKTGAKLIHKENDADSCLQTLLYAYMLEQSGIKISHCEYRYLRFGRSVLCENTPDIQQRVADRLLEFNAALPDINTYFPTDRGKCRYCAFLKHCTMEGRI